MNTPIVVSIRILIKYHTHSSVSFPEDKNIATIRFNKCATDADTICFDTSLII